MNIEFINSARNTRSGFAHDTIVTIDTTLVHKTSAHYINRTWESYTYQSVMKKALDELIDEETERLRNEYKELTGRKRLPRDWKVTGSDKLDALRKRRDELQQPPTADLYRSSKDDEELC